MFQVRKRDGGIVEFDMSKIATALSKAFNAKQVNYTADILNMLTLRVAADFSKKIKENYACQVKMLDRHLFMRYNSFRIMDREGEK